MTLPASRRRRLDHRGPTGLRQRPDPPPAHRVTDNVNQAKGDQDPATWMPSHSAYRCTYVRAWVHVKYYDDLSVGSAEKSALRGYLANC